MAKSQPEGRLGNTIGFIVFEFFRSAARHGAETAWPRAYVAQDHEGRSTARVAFRPIRAAGVLANGFEAELVEETLSKEVLVSARQFALQPTRKPSCRGLA